MFSVLFSEINFSHFILCYRDLIICATPIDQYLHTLYQVYIFLPLFYFIGHLIFSFSPHQMYLKKIYTKYKQALVHRGYNTSMVELTFQYQSNPTSWFPSNVSLVGHNLIQNHHRYIFFYKLVQHF